MVVSDQSAVVLFSSSLLTEARRRAPRRDYACHRRHDGTEDLNSVSVKPNRLATCARNCSSSGCSASSALAIWNRPSEHVLEHLAVALEHDDKLLGQAS